MNEIVFTVSGTTASSITPNSKACLGFIDLFNTSKIYQKTICLIASAVDYSRAVTSCGQFGMSIFDVGSPSDVTAALNFANFQDQRYTFWLTNSASPKICPRVEYSTTNFAWIIHTSPNCSDTSSETFCEFKSQQGKSLFYI